MCQWWFGAVCSLAYVLYIVNLFWFFVLKDEQHTNICYGLELIPFEINENKN
jgi:hypothetical protein